MDPSGSFGADRASGQSSQAKDNIGMEPVYYNAAAKIEIGVLKDIPKPLNQLLTPNRNTVLHIHLTSPIKISEDSKSESSEPAQANVNIGMKADYYNGAANGEIEIFKDFGMHLYRLLTPNRNTVLHIYLTSLKESESNDSKPEDSKSPTTFVKEILGMCPSLLWQANVKGETPLHIAARYGHAAIVEVLIEHAKIPQQDLENGDKNPVQKMLEMTNKEKDTALHEAVRGKHLKVVERLIDEGNDFSYSQNDAGETPLYIAVERGFKEVALHILENCTSPAHDGPLGRTTLHAAVIRCAGYYSISTGMTRDILEKIPEEERSALIKQVDKQGWTPLHCAAYFNCFSTIKMLLEVDRSIAYMKDAKGMTALHIAAHKGRGTIMNELLEYCPDCCELVDQRGWNALHFIVNSSSSYWAEIEIEHILKKPLFNNLFNEKDDDGNTPLHHHSKSLHYIKYVMGHARFDKMAFNKQNLSAYDIALTSEELSNIKFMQITRAFGYNFPREFRRPLEDILPERKDYESWKAESEARKAEWKARKDRFVSIMEKASNSHLVVDTLIATVAFTAGITMPGGFIGQEGLHSGSPVLMRNTAFKVFIITNTIAMVQSCSAAFIHLFMPLLFDEKNVGNFSFLLASLAFCLSISAMGAMALAFVMGTYAVLMHSLGLAIANSVIGLLFFIPVFFVCIGCSDYLLEILKEGSIWILDKLGDFKYFLDNALDDILDCCTITNCFSRGNILYSSAPEPPV